VLWQGFTGQEEDSRSFETSSTGCTLEAKRNVDPWLEANGKGKGPSSTSCATGSSRPTFIGQTVPIVGKTARRAAGGRTVDSHGTWRSRPTGTPRNPLFKAHEWLRYSDSAHHETNTMPRMGGIVLVLPSLLRPNNLHEPLQWAVRRNVTDRSRLSKPWRRGSCVGERNTRCCTCSTRVSGAVLFDSGRARRLNRFRSWSTRGSCWEKTGKRCPKAGERLVRSRRGSRRV
jgi:hypothetical protein